MVNHHVILIGFTQVGKSTIAFALAKKIGATFIDLDAVIEQQVAMEHGCQLTCRELVVKFGEKYFREVEQRVLQEILLRSPSVIALGGGAPCYIQHRESLGHSTIVYLSASPDLIYNRLLDRGFPAYYPTDGNVKAYFEKQWEQRIRIYQHLADVEVLNEGNMEDVMDQIVKRLSL